MAGPTYQELGKVEHVSASPEAKHLDSTKPPHVASSRTGDFQLIQVVRTIETLVNSLAVVVSVPRRKSTNVVDVNLLIYP